jgi:hypothetical protein
MKKKVKEAYKTIEKYEKKQAKKALKNDFRKYEEAGCSRCNKGQIISGGGDACSITYFKRCSCANKKTKRYKNFVRDKEQLKKEMSAYDFEILKNKWYDNNSHIVEGNNSVERSW